MYAETDGRTKTHKENTKEIKALFALAVFIKLDTCPTDGVTLNKTS